MKIGIDLHGMINYQPKFFSDFAKAILAAGGEIHVMTGSHITLALEKELKNYGIEWTRLFSIADYYKDKPGIEMWYDKEGRPWVSEELWNQAKAIYAEEEELDLVMDDTSVYGDYFKTTSFAHCKIINKSGIEHRPKAVMPPKPTEPTERDNLMEAFDKGMDSKAYSPSYRKKDNDESK